MAIWADSARFAAGAGAASSPLESGPPRPYTGCLTKRQKPMKTGANFDRIREENAFAVLARATQLAAQGRDIINLGIGQPDFRTPDHIVEAAIKALRDGHHGYTAAAGIPPLREAVAADLHRNFKVNVSPDEVMILPGGKPIMFM